jgi:hypothetical protein
MSKSKPEQTRACWRYAPSETCPQSFTPAGPEGASDANRRLASRTHDHLHRQASPMDDRTAEDRPIELD